MKTLVIIPTFNEKENIEAIIQAVMKSVHGLNTSILIVDDGSPDGTASIVQTLQKNAYPDNLYLLQRSAKSGLADAYIAGFRWGMHKDYDLLIQMDADFSHDPKYLKEVIPQMKDYDFAVGSRNIRGGGVVGWTVLRNLISKGGSLYSRMILNLPIRDLTGGFNFWKRSVLETIGLENIISKGYSFQIELKYRSFKNGFRYLEFPIIFPDRVKGKSKMSRRILVEAMINIWKLRMIRFSAKGTP
jgi:dolichol-phosphate mannosyltransferase